MRKPRQSTKPLDLVLDAAAVKYRGSTCFYCLTPLLTNLNGTAVMHEDRTPEKGCAQAIRARHGEPDAENDA